MVINKSCKLEKASYNTFFVRAVMVKSLYTLRLSSGYNDLLKQEESARERALCQLTECF